MHATGSAALADVHDSQARTLSRPICKNILYLAVTLFACVHNVCKTCHINTNRHGFRKCFQCRSEMIRCGFNSTSIHLRYTDSVYPALYTVCTMSTVYRYMNTVLSTLHNFTLLLMYQHKEQQNAGRVFSNANIEWIFICSHIL